MTTGMFAMKEGEGFVELREAEYASEDLLQGYLATHPDLIPGDQINPRLPRRWLLVQRELGIPGEDQGTARWSLDHLFLDQESVPTLVEVKRSSDTRIRREVVGQMLDYAANAVAYLKAHELQAAFEAECRAREVEPDDALNERLGIQQDSEAFWQQVKTNLQAGRIRMIFLADRIPDELRRIVEFLNEQMDPAEVLAVEVRQFEGPGIRTLVPRVFGLTSEAESRKAPQGSIVRWGETRFFEHLETQKPSKASNVRDLLTWSRENTDRIDWGKGAVTGSFTPILLFKDGYYPLFSVYSNGTFEIPLQYLKTRPVFSSDASREALLVRFKAIPGLAVQKISLDKRPWFDCTALEPEALAALIELLDDAVTAIRGDQRFQA